MLASWGGRDGRVLALGADVVRKEHLRAAAFASEIAALSACAENPHMVRMLSFCDVKLHILLERWDTDLLQHLMLTQAPVPWQGPMLAILSGLAFLSSRSLVHRDVKPENILMSACTPCPSFVICDFARTTDVSPTGLLTEQRFFGTRPYASPESLCGILCYAADAWGAGVVLFAILERELPYNDDELESETAVPFVLTQTWPDSARSLLEGLLAWEHASRLSADAALGVLARGV